jgi:hypothetical protein
LALYKTAVSAHGNRFRYHTRSTLWNQSFRPPVLKGGGVWRMPQRAEPYRFSAFWKA